jgi:hypothetical protein
MISPVSLVIDRRRPTADRSGPLLTIAALATGDWSLLFRDP